MVIRTFISYVILLLAAILLQPVAAATITVQTDRSQIALNESFQVIFEAEGNLDGDPDFSALKQDFQVLSTVQSSNFSVVNGQITSSKRWTLTLIANEAGSQTIPSVAFGQDVSPALKLQIRGSAGAASQQQDDIFLEASASPTAPYVQSQVIYTLKLYRAVAITKASLADPEVISGNAVLERIDSDKSYETTLNGEVYQVIERNFAIYPQSSGEISIGPVNFMGQISRSRFGMDPFGAPPRTVVRRSQAVKLEVRGIPALFSGDHWLPAENLNIAEEWSGDPMSLRVGEPITRTLILTARGLISSQLPELPAWDNTNLKFYPDRPTLDDEMSDSGITSTRREKAAIIPNEAGNYILPEISVPWWNTRSDSLEYAVVPERNIQVLPALTANSANNGVTGLPAQIPQLPEPRQASAGQQEDNETDALDTEVTASQGLVTDRWMYISLALAMAWLVTLVLWYRRGMGPRPHKTDVVVGRQTENNITLIRAVTSACQANDPRQAKEALLRWARVIWPDSPPLNLGEIANRSGSVLAQELDALNRILYSPAAKDWSGTALQQVFSEQAPGLASRGADNQQAQGNLEPLFRIQ